MWRLGRHFFGPRLPGERHRGHGYGDQLPGRDAHKRAARRGVKRPTRRGMNAEGRAEFRHIAGRHVGDRDQRVRSQTSVDDRHLLARGQFGRSAPSGKGSPVGGQGRDIEHQPEASKLRGDAPPLLGRELAELRRWRRRSILIGANCLQFQRFPNGSFARPRNSFKPVPSRSPSLSAEMAHVLPQSCPTPAKRTKPRNFRGSCRK